VVHYGNSDWAEYRSHCNQQHLFKTDPQWMETDEYRSYSWRVANGPSQYLVAALTETESVFCPV
jgi:hypothetical protein